MPEEGEADLSLQANQTRRSLLKNFRRQTELRSGVPGIEKKGINDLSRPQGQFWQHFIYDRNLQMG